MNPVAFFDIIAFAGFAGSVVIAVVFSRRAAKITKNAAVLIMVTMLSAAFVMFSNTLEHLGVTSQLDWIEDLVGIAFFPLLGYAYYLIWVEQQMDDLKATVRAATAEHDMLLNVMDVTPAAIVLVDAGGRITFANEYARKILDLPLGTGGPYYPTQGRIVPAGARGDIDEGAAFDASVLARSFQAETWEYVAGDARVPLGLSAAPIAGGADAGSVVVFAPLGTMRDEVGGRHDGG
jgi:PAS domain-containing protein